MSDNIQENINKIIHGNSLESIKSIPDQSINCCVTSPPYWGLRDYGKDDQIGLEPNYRDYINNLCNLFDEVKRVLKDDGTCWVNIGDTYSGNSSYSDKGRSGFEPKDGNTKEWLDPKLPQKKRGRELVDTSAIPSKSLVQIPSRFAIEMVDRGWILRNEIIWHKPSCMPSSVKDRFTVDFEKIFFFTKNKRYYFEQQLEPTVSKDTLIRDRETTKLNNTPGRSKMGGLKTNNYDFKNKRTTWTIPTKPFSESHFATFPEKLIEPCILAGCPKDGVVLDPFMGAGTTAVVAMKNNRNYTGIELNKEYIQIAEKRIAGTTPSLF